jgi:hypothetical protein
MPYYRKCPYCGRNNDPGERCECKKDEHLTEPEGSEMQKTWEV